MKKLFSILALACLVACGSVYAAEVCKYKLIMSDTYGDGWNGNKLTLTDDNGPQEFTLLDSDENPKTVEVSYYGGELKGTWTTGGYPYETGFQIYAKNGTLMYEQKSGFSDIPDFTITDDPCATIGEIDVTLLIPSDLTKVDVSQKFYFEWTGTELETTAHKVELTRDGTTRFWKAKVEIADFGFSARFLTDVYKDGENNDEQIIADTYTTYYTKQSVCRELGPVSSFAVVGGVNTYNRYCYETPDECDLKDHNYNLKNVTITPKPGEIELNWMPEQNAPYYYSIEAELDGGGSWYESCSELPHTWIVYETEEKKVTKLTITAYEMYGQVGEQYIDETEYVVPTTDYMPQNVTLTAGEGNTAVLSFDVIPKAGNFVFYLWDENHSYILEGEYPAADAKVEGGKYVFVTRPLTTPGKVNVSITVYDKEGNWRVGYSDDTSFSIATLPDNLGTVKLEVLAPTDQCLFNTSGDVYFSWKKTGETDYTWTKATVNDRVYTAELTVDAPSFQWAIGDQDKAGWSSAEKTGYSSFCTDTKVHGDIEKYYSSYYFYGIPEEEELKDHNWVPQDVAVSVDEAAGTVTYTVTAVTPAPRYELSVFSSASDVDSYEYYSFAPKEDETTTITYTAKSKATSSHKIEKVQVAAYNEVGYLVCDALVKTTTYIIPANVNVPRGLKATVESDNSITLEWDASPEASHYYAYVNFDATTIASWNISTADEAPVGGKYTKKIDKVQGNGTYYFYVDSYVDDSYYAEGFLTFNVTTTPALGSVNIDVLRPSDNNFPDGTGVRLYWWPVGGLGTFVDPTIDGNHYKATITTTEPAIRVLVANTDDWSGEQTEDSRIIVDPTACFELKYNPYTSSKWVLLDDETCAATDHDFRVSSLEVNNDVAGKATFTLTAMNDYAPYYTLSYKPAGSTDPYESFASWKYDGKPLTVVTPFTTDTKIDIQVIAYSDKGYQLADPFETTMIDVKANPNTPSDLKAVVDPDGHHVTFSWTKNGTLTDHFALYAWDKSNGWNYVEEVALTATTYTAEFYVPWQHDWEVLAIDAEGNLLAIADGPSFTITGTDPVPTNLEMAVAGRTANFAWDAPDGVTQCVIELYNSKTSEDTLITIIGKDGHYTYSYTLEEDASYEYWWYVVATIGKETPISSWVSGGNFTIEGFSGDPDPEKWVTLTVSAAPGGSVQTTLSGMYPKGTYVDVEAKPADGWYFDKWSDGYYSQYYTIELTQDTVIEAQFLQNKSYTFTVEAGSGGKVNKEVNGIYKGGRTIHLKATPNSGYNFNKWSDENKDKERDFVITENTAMKALFKQIVKYTLTVEISGSGTVTLDGVEEEGNKKTVEEGKTITIDATPGSDYKFARFEDGGTDITTSPYTVTMTENKTIKAVFVKKTIDVENVDANVEQPTKILQEGNLYILRDGVIYTVTGAKVK